tara:strand:+ start:1459 stop:1575 length:117 start_codon:yes stop_codon:yes gene_type:complete
MLYCEILSDRWPGEEFIRYETGGKQVVSGFVKVLKTDD